MILDRVLIRKPQADIELLNELIQSTKDRIVLRYGIRDPVFPIELDSVCVEIVTALYNRHEVNHEGVKSESVDAFSISFVDDVIAQYDAEILGYLEIIQPPVKGVVRFL